MRRLPTLTDTSRLLSNASRSNLSTAAVQRTPEKVVCSLFESGKIDVSIGICFINLATGEITLSNVFDSQTFVRTVHKLNVFEPSEIIVPQNYLVKNSKLITILKANISPDVRIVGFESSAFDVEQGMREINSLCLEKDKQYLANALQDKNLVLSALSAAVKYSRKSKSCSYDNFRFRFEASESIMFIDSNTSRSLQLVQSSTDIKGASLFKFMNHTMTKMGERSLRNNILQPLIDEESITERLGAVKELKDDNQLMGGIRNELKNCRDLDKLFAVMLISRNEQHSIHNESYRVNNIILIKQAVSIALTVSELLKDCSSPLLAQINEICSSEGIVQIKDIIDDTINEDCTWAVGALDIKNQRCYAVKSGRNGLLDVSRQVYKVVIEEIFAIIKSLSEEFNLELEQGYNSSRGFYIKILDYKNVETIPEIFINRVVKKKFIECSTLDIIKCNSRLDDTVNEILTISNQILGSTIDEVSTFLPIMFMFAEALSLLDLLQSFAFLAIKQNYILPEFSDHLSLKSTRHPIVETLIDTFIPNDVCCINDISRFQVITGTNMSGKSIYLKQVALISVMAQMGSFVPADCAILKIFESLKARICVDSISATNGSVSTFTNEMNDMVCILEEVNDKSLVIIDELGRGSSINDGYAISLAICENLVSTFATVFVSTHFHKLSKVLSTKPGVVQYHMKTEVIEDSQDLGVIKMKYRLTGGSSESKFYGISMARLFFDKDLIERGLAISRKLETSNRNYSMNEAEALRNKKFYNLVSVLKFIHDQPQSEISANLLLKVQNEFLS